MKYCPFCGADLLCPEVSFCTECGKQLPAGNVPQAELGNRPNPVENPRNSRKKPAPVRPKREPKKKARSSIEDTPTERILSQFGKEQPLDPQPKDDYDGYYDDVEPLDAGDTRPGLDREMIKKISFLLVGALLVIGLCVVLMTIL